MTRIIATLTVIFIGLMAQAHSWYDPACCSGRDCAPIPFHTVQIVPEGFKVTLTHADHPLVPAGETVEQIIPDDAVKTSLDGQYHACVISYEDFAGGSNGLTIYIRCLYVGGMA